LFELGLGPFALSFLTVPHGLTVEECKRKIEWMIDRDPASWQGEWVEQQGLIDLSTSLRVALAGAGIGPESAGPRAGSNHHLQ
jgi:hypothetical protein